MHTREFNQEVYDRCFKRSYDVEFLFNTDIGELKRKIKTGNMDRPVLVIIWPEMFMSQYSHEFQNALRDYNSMFEVYYVRRQEDVKDLFHTQIMPKELIHLYLLDPQQREKYQN